MTTDVDKCCDKDLVSIILSTEASEYITDVKDSDTVEKLDKG
jgi:hypothetical protein